MKMALKATATLAGFMRLSAVFNGNVHFPPFLYKFIAQSFMQSIFTHQQRRHEGTWTPWKSRKMEIQWTHHHDTLKSRNIWNTWSEFGSVSFCAGRKLSFSWKSFVSVTWKAIKLYCRPHLRVVSQKDSFTLSNDSFWILTLKRRAAARRDLSFFTS